MKGLRSHSYQVEYQKKSHAWVLTAVTAVTDSGLDSIFPSLFGGAAKPPHNNEGAFFLAKRQVLQYWFRF